MIKIGNVCSCIVEGLGVVKSITYDKSGKPIYKGTGLDGKVWVSLNPQFVSENLDAYNGVNQIKGRHPVKEDDNVEENRWSLD